MASGDYINCCKCGTKLIYDGHWSHRDWWEERWDKQPEIKCPDCDTEPQPRREVELTDEEIGHAAFSNMTRICKDEWVADDKQVLAFARAVIEAYKAKQESRHE